MRKRKVQPAENHERWLVSYADFITLLFAFFVVMFASTQSDKSHAKAVSEAITKALKDGSIAPKIAAILGGSIDHTGKGNAMMHGPGGMPAPKRSEPAADTLVTTPLTEPMRILEESLHGDIAAGDVSLKLERRGLIIGLQTAAFFPSGGDTVAVDAYSTLAKLAAVLNKVTNPISLEGHTDSVPINTARFQSNWELSAARSIAMLRILSERYSVNSQRMAIVGYADNASIDSNETAEGRGRNRRVDIVILSGGAVNADLPAGHHRDSE